MGCVSSSGAWTALDHIAAGRLGAGGDDVQARPGGELGELAEGAGLAARYQHVDAERARRFVGRDTAEDGDGGLRGSRRLGAAAEDGYRRFVGPVVEDALEQVEVGSGRQRVEEALPLDRHPASHPEAFNEPA